MYLVQERLRQRSAPLYKHLMLSCLSFFTQTEFPSVIKWILDLAILSIFVGSKEIQFCPYVLQRKKSAANNTNFCRTSAFHHSRQHLKIIIPIYHPLIITLGDIINIIFFIPTQIYLVITINLSKMKDEVSNPL